LFVEPNAAAALNDVMASHLVLHEPNTREYEMSVLTRIQGKLCDKHVYKCTVESRYLELGYFEFCDPRSVYLNKKYIFIAFANHSLAFETFLQVQITRSANKFALRVI